MIETALRVLSSAVEDKSIYLPPESHLVRVNVLLHNIGVRVFNLQ